jgi:hypothetical protein
MCTGFWVGGKYLTVTVWTDFVLNFSLFTDEKPQCYLISKQFPQEPNPLYILGRIPQQMATPSEQ